MDAARQIRSTREDAAGEPQHLFRDGQPESGPMRFCVETIVPGLVEDDFGVSVKPAITFLRYEVVIDFESASAPQRHGRLVVRSEKLDHINRGQARTHIRFPHSKAFRDHIVTGRRSGGAFISTQDGAITVHQDGGSRGRPKRALPANANTTVVSTINSADDPTILALRREMQSWRRLALEPTAMRAADRFVDPVNLTSDGGHLAASLHRIAMTPNSDGFIEPENVYARVASRLAGLSGISVMALRVDEDDSRQMLTLVISDRNGNEFPARSLSEGTLRYLALCVMLEDFGVTGLVCMEEPENGIHPGSLHEIVSLIRDIAVDPMDVPGPDNPLRQVIVNTHSPAVVQLVQPDEILYATEQPGRPPTRKRSLCAEGLRSTWRNGENGVLKIGLIDYLTPPPGAQLRLFDDVA